MSVQTIRRRLKHLEERFCTVHELREEEGEEITELLRRLDEEEEKLRDEPNYAVLVLELAREVVEELVRRGDLRHT